MEGIDTKQWQIHLNALHPSSQLKYNKCIKQFIEFIDEQNLSLHPERIIDNVIYFASYLRKDVAPTMASFLLIVIGDQQQRFLLVKDFLWSSSKLQVGGEVPLVRNDMSANLLK